MKRIKTTAAFVALAVFACGLAVADFYMHTATVAADGETTVTVTVPFAGKIDRVDYRVLGTTSTLTLSFYSPTLTLVGDSVTTAAATSAVQNNAGTLDNIAEWVHPGKHVRFNFHKATDAPTDEAILMIYYTR